MKLEETIKSTGFKSEKQKAAVNIMFTAYQVKTNISQTLKHFKLTPEQYNVLRILKGAYPGQMCVRDIARRMIERSSNVPRIIDRLESKKLVTRSQSGDDRRETVITLSPDGISLLDTVNPVLEHSQNHMCGLDEENLRTLNELLDRYLKD